MLAVQWLKISVFYHLLYLCVAVALRLDAWCQQLELTCEH